MKNLKTFSLALAMLISFLTFGQEKTIIGAVSDSSGPLPGASVVIKGTTKGVQTNIDGKYSIKAKTGDILIYSFIGYDSKNITVGTANVINVKLSENSKTLEEVLITGAMGIKRKKDAVFTSALEISSSGAKNVLPQNYLQNKI